MRNSLRLLALAMVTVMVLAEAIALPFGISAQARLGAGATSQAGEETRTIHIAAERFTFTPSEIRVKAGTRLEIRLESDDTAHGFHIVGTDVDIELPKRGRGAATVTFQPQPGRYTFECSRVCGAGHEFMRGVIIAE
jgi:cytochrome c oxidase subunit 2